MIIVPQRYSYTASPNQHPDQLLSMENQQLGSAAQLYFSVANSVHHSCNRVVTM